MLQVRLYHKFLKIGIPKNCNCPENGTIWFYNAVMHLKDADGMMNNVDPDQTAP